MTLLGEIIAGGLALVAGVLRLFVNVTVQPASEGAANCGVADVYAANLNGCGLALVDQLGQLIYSGVALLNSLLGGLAAVQLT